MRLRASGGAARTGSRVVRAAAQSTFAGRQWEPLLLKASSTWLIAAVTLASPADGPPVPKASLVFELVSSAPALKPDGSPEEDRYDACLFGRYGPGQEVLLLSSRESKTCAVATGRVGKTEYAGGDCTVLLGMERCAGSYELGVMGARGAYRLVEARPAKDEERAALEGAVSKAKAAEKARTEWINNLEIRPYEVQDRIDAALIWPKRVGMPRLARLKLDDPSNQGPWVAIQRGRVGALVGPLTLDAPWAFTLDGKTYLVFTVAVCRECGGVGTEVYAVHNGKLDRVLESFANAN